MRRGTEALQVAHRVECCRVTMSNPEQQIQTKRIYEPPARPDGRRILVDRLWPRGLSKSAASIDFWARSVAPSNALRRWYQHDPEKLWIHGDWLSLTG